MTKTIWFKRSDGERFACEDGSATYKMMLNDGSFELETPSETVVDEVELETPSLAPKATNRKSKKTTK